MLDIEETGDAHHKQVTNSDAVNNLYPLVCLVCVTQAIQRMHGNRNYRVRKGHRGG